MSQTEQQRLSLRLERALGERITELARQADRSVSAEIRTALRAHLAIQEPRPDAHRVTRSDAGRGDAAPAADKSFSLDGTTSLSRGGGRDVEPPPASASPDGEAA